MLTHSATAPETTTHERLKQTCTFLTNYGTAMLSAGATAHRICQNIEKMAMACGTRADCSIMPARVMLTLWDDAAQHSYTSVGRTRAAGINIRTTAELDALASSIACGKASPATAQQALSRIAALPRLSPWLVTPLVGCANASFCRLFGGDATAMLIVWIATVMGYALKAKLLTRHIDARLVTLIAATVAAVASTAGYVWQLGRTPELALGTAVLFLVPGIPYINALTDLLTGHHLCALSRFIDALMTTLCLALGLSLAMLLTQIDYQ